MVQTEENEVQDGTTQTEKDEHVAEAPKEEDMKKDVKDRKSDPLALLDEEARMLFPNKCFVLRVSS